MLSIKNLRKSFNKGTENELLVFDGFDLEIESGKITALLGANGCGKSTLMALISGSEMADEGNILLDGEEITCKKEFERADRIAKVHQNSMLGVSPSLTILENMSLAEKKGGKMTLRQLVNRNKRVEFAKLLEPLQLNLEQKLDVQTKFLSGGQRQAMSLVLTTLKKPDLLLLDEHTAALDPKTSRLIMEKTMVIAREQQITTIMISHNLRDAIRYSDRLIMLHEGKIILDVLPSEISEQELVQIFNRENQIS